MDLQRGLKIVRRNRMTSLPNASELEKRIPEAWSILLEEFSSKAQPGEENYLIHVFQDELQNRQEKYARIYALREPFEQAKLSMKENPKRSLFSSPYKHHKKAIKEFEDILERAYESIQQEEEHLEKALNMKAEQNAFQATLMSNENLQRLRKSVNAEAREQNASAKAMSNFANELRRRETEEANAARQRMAQRLQNIDRRYDASMNALLRRGGAKKTRRGRKSSKRTRKH